MSVAKVARKLGLRRTMTPNQIVAYNVAKARELRGWTQEQAAEALAPYLGAKLSVGSFSALGRSASNALPSSLAPWTRRHRTTRPESRARPRPSNAARPPGAPPWRRLERSRRVAGRCRST